ncbi:hypothetical protein BX666DRAFT_1985271 [Dichotomocladium elegans]|nr:hypothetical protein BX666DRAFT_1985271 [Dichotomocladium elegans]
MVTDELKNAVSESSTTTTMTHSTDDTAKNIAGLYTRLQAAIDKKIHTDPTNTEAKFIPLPPSLPMSPSSSSPTPILIPRVHTGSMSTPRSSSCEEDNSNSNTCNSITEEENEARDSSNSALPLECCCRRILQSKESDECSLCHRKIPLMEQLHQERLEHQRTIEELEARVQEEQTRIAQQLTEIEGLQGTLAEVEERLDVKEKELKRLQGDMEMLNDKYVDEIERVAEIQHSKDMVENELEDLSRRLFEEANGMVANEKREKHNLELAQKQLEKQLQETQERLAAEQMQLQELRLRMEEMALEQDEFQQRQQLCSPVDSIAESEDDTPEEGASNTAEEGPSDASAATTPTMANGPPTTCSNGVLLQSDKFDVLMLAEFDEFIKSSPSVQLKKLHTSIPFLKNCLAEDVEPCLRFGANPRLSARKIAEAIVMNTCFIEEAPVGFAEEQARRPPDMPLRISTSKTMIWERISNGGNPLHILGACQACGRQDQHPLPYRFRTSYFDDWACIDRFCRDRLVAVCEFYVFIRNVRQGYYSTRSLPDLYQEAMRLRLQMFYARLGTLPWSIRTQKPDEVLPGASPLAGKPPSSPVRTAQSPTLSESSPLPRSKISYVSPSPSEKQKQLLTQDTSADGRKGKAGRADIITAHSAPALALS